MGFPRTRHLYSKDPAKMRQQLANEEAGRKLRPKIGEPNAVIDKSCDRSLIVGHDGTYCYVANPNGISQHIYSIEEGRAKLAETTAKPSWTIHIPVKNAEIVPIIQLKPETDKQ